MVTPDAMVQRRQNSLQRKFIIGIVAVLLLVCLPAVVFMANRQARIIANMIEADGRELASYTAKLSATPLLDEDSASLDVNVLELCKSDRVLYAVVQDKKGVAATGRFSSFNRNSPEVKAAKANMPADAGTQDLVDAIRRTTEVIEVQASVMSDDQRIGNVIVGMATQVVSTEKRATLLSVLSVFAVLFVVACLVLVLGSQRLVLRPLVEIARTTTLAAQGDLTQRIRVRSGDEIGQLGRSFNQLIESLSGTVQRIQASFERLVEISTAMSDIARTVSAGSTSQTAAIRAVTDRIETMVKSLRGVMHTVDELTAAAEGSATSTLQMSASIAEVARSADALAGDADTSSATVRQTVASVEQVARGADDLLSQVSSVTDSISNINDSIGTVESHAQQAQSLATMLTESVAKEGNESVQLAVAGMDRNRQSIDRLAGVIRDLADRSSGIEDIVSVIRGIADQTNLLALNASILAAQAGEHGRGFEVVAQEIRSLADNTSSNTKKIADLTQTIQNDTKKAMEAMEDGSRLAGEGVNLIGDVQRTLDKVSESSQRSTDATKFIARSTAEQLQAAAKISGSAEQMKHMAREIATATREQSQGVGQLARVIEQLNQMSANLRAAASAQTGASEQLSESSTRTAKLAGTISEAVTMQSEGAESINEALRRVQAVASDNSQVSSRLAKQVTLLGEQAELLKSDIGRLTVRR